MIEIRPLSPDEVHEAAALLPLWMKDAFRNLIPSKALTAFTPERALNRLTTELAPPALTLAARDQNKLLGLGQADGAEVSLLYVAPETRGDGIGGDLLLALFNAMSHAGHGQAHLIALKANSRTRRFYERHGGQVEQSLSVKLAGHPLPHVRYVFALGKRA